MICGITQDEAGDFTCEFAELSIEAKVSSRLDE
jgi:hypothetical protein